MWEALALTAALCQVLRNTVMKRLGHELDEYVAVWGGFTFLLPFAALFVLFAIRAITAALRAPDRFGMLLAMGCTFLIVIQAFINIGVVTSSWPVTGVPLPFISSGGTSLIVSLIAVGLIASVLVSPYVNFYDLSALILAAWLILRTRPARWQQAVTLGMYVPLYGAPIWPLITLAYLCGWLVSLALPSRREPRKVDQAAA